MTRENKYPDTKTFHYFNANPKNRIGADCVIRAVCTGLDKGWGDTVREMTEVGIKHGYVLNDTACVVKYLDSLGYVKQKQPRKADGTKYTGSEFCRYLNNFMTYKGHSIIANIGGHHMVCIKEHHDSFAIFDIWDSTDKCIGNYWVI